MTTDPPPSPSPSSDRTPRTPRPGGPSPRPSRRLRLGPDSLRPKPKPGDAGYDPLADDVGEPPVTVDSSDAGVLDDEPRGAVLPGSPVNPTAATVPSLPATMTGSVGAIGSAGTRTGIRRPVRRTPSSDDVDAPPATLDDAAGPVAPAAPDTSGSSSSSSGSGRYAGTASETNIEGLEVALAMATRSKFHIGRELGRGGTAQVLAARDVSLRRDVALKYLARPEAGQARFIEEAQITAQLQHPNIVPVYELGVDRQKRAYMAMKRVHGRTLAQVIANAHGHSDRHPTEWARFLRRLLDVFVKVCDAIGYAHARKVIHRDLKPDNVMVGAFGEVLVMDWGLARPIGADVPESVDLLVPGQKPPSDVKSDRRHRNALLTLDGQILGTLPYMPPEQAEGRHSELDTRADIYSLGAILYQVLTNSPPFTGTDIDKLQEQVSAGRLVPPSRRGGERVPRELEGVVLRAMAFDPEDRYPTVGALRADIERYLDGRALESVQYGKIELLAKWVQRNRVMAGGIAATVLAVLAGVIGMVLVDSEARARDARAQADQQRVEGEKRDAELKSVRLQAEREAAERRSLVDSQARREAELRTMVQQGEIDKLRETLGVGARDDASEMVREFKTLYDAARIAGKENEFIAHLGQQRIDQFAGAFERLLQSGLEVTPRDRMMAAFLYILGMKDPQRALAQCNLALEQDAAYADAYFVRGMAHADLGNHQAALEDYNAVLSLQPGNQDALFNRAKARTKLGDRRGAIEDYTALTRINPRHAGAYVNRGAQFGALGDQKSAEDDFTKAIEIDQQMVHAWHNRGKVRLGLGNQRGAVEDFEHALAINPDLHDCRLDRVSAMIGVSPAGARADLDYVLRAEPGNWRANFLLGVLLGAQGKRDEAIAAMDNALANAPPQHKGLVADTRKRMLGD